MSFLSILSGTSRESHKAFLQLCVPDNETNPATVNAKKGIAINIQRLFLNQLNSPRLKQGMSVPRNEKIPAKMNTTKVSTAINIQWWSLNQENHENPAKMNTTKVSTAINIQNIQRWVPNQLNRVPNQLNNGLSQPIKLNIVFLAYLGGVEKNPASKAEKAAIEAKHIVEKVLKYSNVPFQNSKLAW
jgi:hypothetical protein